jgi:DNA recombination protein RmuC
MAEDVLRLIGFVENVNYYKQKSIDGSGARPDFTFPLPKGAVLNMDVKFPFDNYLRYLEVEDESQKALFRTAFLRDVRSKIKEVATRGYINQEQNTLDFALLFIPNEQIYSFIQECDGSILDEALQNKVIFCSPTTLYAVLSVIRKAADDFALERTSGEILKLLGTFRVQWEKFLERLNHLGKQIEGAYKDYEELATTRKRQLEKPLDAIEALKRKNLSSRQENEEGVAEGLDDLSNDANIQIEKCDAPRDTRR